MRRGIIVVATVFATLSIGASASWAGSPHIVAARRSDLSRERAV